MGTPPGVVHGPPRIADVADATESTYSVYVEPLTTRAYECQAVSTAAAEPTTPYWPPPQPVVGEHAICAYGESTPEPLWQLTCEYVPPYGAPAAHTLGPNVNGP